MRTRTILFLLLFLGLHGNNLYAVSPEPNFDTLSSKIADLSGKYLNYNCSTADDSDLSICNQMISLATLHGNHAERFKAEQVCVNILCLQGNLGQGICMAKKMYEQAKDLNHPSGKALALQAIGATYMHASQYDKALLTFTEVEPLLRQYGDTLSQMRLVIQQLYTCMQLKDSSQMQLYLSTAQEIIKLVKPQQRDIYSFYLHCYETMFYIYTGQSDKARHSIEEEKRHLPNNLNLARWHYQVLASFHDLQENYPKALIYLDSTLQRQQQTGNLNLYKNTMYEKATLLEKTGDYQEACKAYASADSLTNILNMQHYKMQIEDLHIVYHVDQMAIENIKMQNKFLTNILICSIAFIFFAIILIFKTIRRNKLLILSREKLSSIRQVTAESIQSKSVFLSNMSHDLRTPLNAIVGFSEILTTTEEDDQEMKQQSRNYIKQNSELLMKLVNDIVDFSTLKEARIKFDFERHDVVSLCQNVIETVSNVKQTNAKLVFTTTLKRLEIETDSARLQQVLINLLVNATKFTKVGFIHLNLSFDKQTNEATFTVEDSGCGIPLDKQNQIFNRFEKLHETVQGVGLGLSICQLIVERVHGRIWIDSQYTEGARFVFTHPVAQTQQEQNI